MRYLLCFFPLLLLGCAGLTHVYENNAGSCKLKLYSDSTYALTYPTFFRKRHEDGTYRITNDTLVLQSEKGSKHFLYGSDTVIARGIDPKVMTDRKLILKK
jgi:hypothetical protein